MSITIKSSNINLKKKIDSHINLRKFKIDLKKRDLRKDDNKKVRRTSSIFRALDLHIANIVDSAFLYLFCAFKRLMGLLPEGIAHQHSFAHQDALHIAHPHTQQQDLLNLHHFIVQHQPQHTQLHTANIAHLDSECECTQHHLPAHNQDPLHQQAFQLHNAHRVYLDNHHTLPQSAFRLHTQPFVHQCIQVPLPQLAFRLRNQHREYQYTRTSAMSTSFITELYQTVFYTSSSQ